MSWDGRLLAQAGPGDALGPLVEGLFAEQLRDWPLLREHVEALDRVQVQRLDLGDSHLLVQSNPARHRSTAARVDTSFVARRPCFLCEPNLPPEERGVGFGRDLVLAPNPYPILPGHLSIPARDHGPQAIAGRSRALLELARALGPAYLLLYNGPRCGASAPDHFHFQATLRQGLPIADEVRRLPAAERMASIDSFGRRALVLRGSDAAGLAVSIEDAVTALGGVVAAAAPTTASAARHADDVLADDTVHGSSRRSRSREGGPGEVQPRRGRGAAPSARTAEPMLNLIAYDDGASLVAVLFPRAAHRPACFFAAEGQRILISPGALDMAGVVVVAEAGHFERVDLEVVRRIFDEVSLDAARFGRWLEVLR